VLRGINSPAVRQPALHDHGPLDCARQLLCWTRRNATTLAETTPLLPITWQEHGCPTVGDAPASMPREPYGYAIGVRGVVWWPWRNPWIVGQNYALTIPPLAGASARATSLTCAVYIQNVVYMRVMCQPGQTVQIPLAPYETVVLECNTKSVANGIVEATQVLNGNVRVQVQEHTASMLSPPSPAAGTAELRLHCPDRVVCGQWFLAGPTRKRPQPVAPARRAVILEWCAGCPGQPQLGSGLAGSGLPAPAHWFVLQQRYAPARCR